MVVGLPGSPERVAPAGFLELSLPGGNPLDIATLSASSLKAFEDCECMFRISYVEKIREAGGKAADLGSCIHEVLEKFVFEKAAEGDDPAFQDWLHVEFDALALGYRLEAKAIKDGHKMLDAFWTEWIENPPYSILSTEIKETFELPTSRGKLPVTYIFDRCDKMEDGSINVVDYKTIAIPIDAETMKSMIQPRIYALAAYLKYRHEEPPSIWVTYHMLRHGCISVKFTKADCKATWTYLKECAERIYESEGTAETISDSCRWCLRKSECDTLDRATRVGSILRVTDPEDAAERLAKLKVAMAAMSDTATRLEDFLGEWMVENKVEYQKFPSVSIKLAPRRTRKIESERLTRILDPEIMRHYGKMGITEIDAILADPDVDEETKRTIRELITTTVSVKATASFKKS